MKRLIPLLLAIAAPAAALDTPLVLRVQGNSTADINRALIVNPSSGTMTLYNVTTQSLEQQVAAGFALDVDVLDKFAFDQKGVAYSALRLGSGGQLGATWKVNTESLIAQLPNRKVGDKPSLQEAVRAAENEWWGKEQKYDGVVRAAWNGDYAFLCIPSKHVVMVYATSENGIVRHAWQNYGPLLMLPGGYKTAPKPSEVYNALPELQKKQLEEEARKAEEELGDKPRATPSSDAWVGAVQNDTFFVVDLANRRIVTFKVGKTCEIAGVRDITAELRLPPRQNWHSTPDALGTVQQYHQANKRDLQAAGLESFITGNDALYNMRALVQTLATKPQGGKSVGFQANAFDDKIVLDFTDQRKLVTYALANDQIELVSVRDYTTDLAVSSLDDIIKKKYAARELLKSAEQNSRNHEFALRTLKFALDLDPTLIAAVEKNTRLVNELKKEEEAWGPLLDDAHKAKDAYEEKLKGIAELAKKLREEDEALEKGPKKDEAPK